MKNKRIKQGFTLIELLVVVLIIGILAAVALPQYQVAVAKTRFSKLQSILHTYKNAADIYVVENGEWPASFNDLDITAPEGMTTKTPSGSVCVQNNEFYCCMQTANGDQASGISCGLMDYSLVYQYRYLSYDGKTILNKYWCYSKQENAVSNKVCSAYNSSRSSTNAVTPTGHRTGYYYYVMP